MLLLFWDGGGAAVVITPASLKSLGRIKFIRTDGRVASIKTVGHIE